jgi:hypothetical protein
MRVLDLSQDFSMHTPAFASYDGPSIKWVKRLAFDKVGGQEITSTLHVGTHLDGPVHFWSGGRTIGELMDELARGFERALELGFRAIKMEAFFGDLVSDRELVGCIRGIGEACRALDFPVVSGNVSLYNETNGKAILPTPSIGGVGVSVALRALHDHGGLSVVPRLTSRSTTSRRPVSLLGSGYVSSRRSTA